MRTHRKAIGVLILGSCLGLLLGGLFLQAQDNGFGCLKVKAHPSVAGVFVDDKYVGPAANLGSVLVYSVPAGEHEITLRDPRYLDFSTKVNIEAGKTTTLSQSLQPGVVVPPPYGTLQIQGGSCKFDAVFVNDKFMGHVGEFNKIGQGLLLNPGEYTVKVVSAAGNQELEEKIKMEAKKTTRVHVGC
jgi:hypothetical protein